MNTLYDNYSNRERVLSHLFDWMDTIGKVITNRNTTIQKMYKSIFLKIVDTFILITVL